MSKAVEPRASRLSSWALLVHRLVIAMEAALVIAAVAVITGCLVILGVLALDSERGSEWTGSLRPVQFYAQIDVELLEDYSEVFAVAHNSGDSVDATLEALSYGADVIEVDVISLNGRLYAAHGTPPSWIGSGFFTGPPLERIWIAAAMASAIKLDLKESSPAFRELLAEFLRTRQGRRRVIIVSGNPDLLRYFSESNPDVLRFFSIGSDGQYRQLIEDPELTAIIDGVSIRHTLVNDERAEWLNDNAMLTLAWTVNDMDRVNELVTSGVDAITTDNLAIMNLLGGERRSSPQLDRLRVDPTNDP